MGSVFLGRHLALGRPVAIKVLDSTGPRRALDSTESQAWTWAVARFLREARLAAKVRHHNVIDVHDFGSTPEGIAYIVMEALSGRDLRAIVRGQGSSWAWTRFVMRQVCAGVAAIHRAGVVHRDLKASNCFFVARTRQIKILDFGIATDLPTRRASRDQPRRTVVGTPEYMAPEQIRGAAPDRRCDVYAAGILMFELLTGHTPFQGRSAEQVFDGHLYEPVPRLPPRAGCRAGAPDLEPELSRWLDSVLTRALAKDPNRRFQSMVELGRALDGGPGHGGRAQAIGSGGRASLRRLFDRATSSPRFDRATHPQPGDTHDDMDEDAQTRRPGPSDPVTLHSRASTSATPLALELP